MQTFGNAYHNYLKENTTFTTFIVDNKNKIIVTETEQCHKGKLKVLSFMVIHNTY